jgi:hypothetical protein
MSSKNNQTTIQGVNLLLGLAIGQIFVFFILSPEGWQAVDKALFGLALGVGTSGLLSGLAYIFLRKK